jgi:hypothetical protein
LPTAALAQSPGPQLTGSDARQIESRCKLRTGSLSPTQSMTTDFRKFVCVAKQFRKRNLKISFISTPINPDKAENAQTH